MEKNNPVLVVQMSPCHVLVSFPADYKIEDVYRMLRELVRAGRRSAPCRILMDMRLSKASKMSPSLFAAVLEALLELVGKVEHLVLLEADGLTARITSASVKLLPIAFPAKMTFDLGEAEEAWGFRIPSAPDEDNQRLPSR